MKTVWKKEFPEDVYTIVQQLPIAVNVTFSNGKIIAIEKLREENCD